MVRKVQRKYLFASLKNDFSRLLAIIIIVFLGVSFLIGLLQTGPDIQKTADNYYKEQQLYDVSLMSSNGISGEDKQKIYEIIEELDEVKDISAETNLELDGKINDLTSHISFNYQENPKVNRLKLISGRLPNNKDECVVLGKNSNLTKVEIGDTISCDLPIVGTITYKVVGLVLSPKYISKQQIVSLTSSRIINSIVYLYEPPIAMKNFFTSVEISLKVDKKTNCYSKEYRKNIETFKIKLESLLKENLADIDYIILDRNHNESLSILDSDINKINKVSNIFPLFFFIITVLVASTSLSRIVTKDRFIAGSFKALGFYKTEISKKVLLYSIVSSLIGIGCGIVIGIFLLPFVIHVLYQTLYNLPSLLFSFNPLIVISISLAVFIIIVALALGYEYVLLKESPAQLFIDKAPKPGKKILLERIKPIWKIIPFRFKSMFRNVFRFKKNLIMMIIGVGGSSALLLAGFGMSDSVKVLTDTQYKEIFHYDIISEFNLPFTDEDLGKTYFSDYMKVAYYSGNSINNETKYHFQMIGGAYETISDYIKINAEFDSNSVIVTEQLLSGCNIKLNEKNKFNINGKDYELVVSGTTRNHIGNFIYIGEDVLSSMIKEYEAIDYNAYLGNLIDNSEENIDQLSKLTQVKSIFIPKRQLTLYENLLSNLTYLVLILIGLSGLLLITIQYNLVDINVSDRKKELSTLKVLGYQKSELLMYIFREIIIMTVFGLAFGLGIGVLLHKFIITSITSPGIIFGKSINGLSYLYTIVLTMVFSTIVTLLLSFKINKIDMVGALKANE